MSEHDKNYPVNRTAMIPATYVDEKGVQHGDDWPLNTTQTVKGTASDGSIVTIGSTASQAGPNVAARVTGSSILVQHPVNGTNYTIDFDGTGHAKGHGDAAKIALSGTQGLNLAHLLHYVTDPDQVSEVTLDRTLDQFRQSTGIERK